jgi:hypothetical protein
MIDFDASRSEHFEFSGFSLLDITITNTTQNSMIIDPIKAGKSTVSIKLSPRSTFIDEYDPRVTYP